MIELLKIYHAGKIFGKICLKAIRDTFLSNMWSKIKGGIRALNFLVEVISSRRENFKLLALQEDPSSQLPPLVWHPNGAWSAYCNDFQKSEWKYFLSKQQIYSMNLKMKKGGKFIDDIQSTNNYPSILR